jgi:hypothetical protein
MPKDKPNPAAELARRRAESLTPERRTEIARKAVKARWDKERARKQPASAKKK